MLDKYDELRKVTELFKKKAEKKEKDAKSGVKPFSMDALGIAFTKLQKKWL